MERVRKRGVAIHSPAGGPSTIEVRLAGQSRERNQNKVLSMEAEGGVGSLKPSRSEAKENLTEEEKAKYTQQVQDYQKITTPVRALKPYRSESLGETALLDCLPAPKYSSNPELERFKKLHAEGGVMQMDGGPVNDDSYVETSYYDELNKSDKSLHHKTGSGFIAGESSSLSFKVGEEGPKIFRTSSQTNPACNEW